MIIALKSAFFRGGACESGAVAQRDASVLPRLLAAMLLALAVATPARAANKATVRLQIVVAPAARIEFPGGRNFILRVHDDGHRDEHVTNGPAEIAPVVIPFTVHGNATAAVSAEPESFMQVHDGPWLGRADFAGPGAGNGRENELGYNVIVEFPASQQNHIDPTELGGFPPTLSTGLAGIPGLQGSPTPPLSAQAANWPNGVPGRIYIVSDRYWTGDGRIARPGYYGGSIQVSVTAAETDNGH